MNPTIEKFGYPGSLIRQYRHWVVLLRPQQVTLGSLVLAATEPARQFHELPEAAFTELKTVVEHVETGLRPLVDYQRINYLMLMMVDPDVHFHVIPRYQAAAELDGLAFPDHGWPGPPALASFTQTAPRTNETIKARLLAQWPG